MSLYSERKSTDRACYLQGLEAQLLGIVVRKEKPELEEQKDNLVLSIAGNKKKLQELEDEILRYGRSGARE
jgi:hypothetical protein